MPFPYPTFYPRLPFLALVIDQLLRFTFGRLALKRSIWLELWNVR